LFIIVRLCTLKFVTLSGSNNLGVGSGPPAAGGQWGPCGEFSSIFPALIHF